MPEELKVIQDFYDFILWTVNHTSKFPRHHRHSLGVDIERRMQSILALLLRAKYTRERALLLDEANLELEILRFQLRLAKDLQILSIRSQGHAAGLLLAIGRQIGGWARRGRTAP